MASVILVSVGLGNGWSPAQHQTITTTNKELNLNKVMTFDSLWPGEAIWQN